MSASTMMPHLQPLLPVTMTPTRKFKALEPLALLEKIDRIEINGTIVRGGVVFYILDVYLKHCSSRIPTNKTAKATCSDRPDYQLERRFNDFANLRYQVWAYAQRRVPRWIFLQILRRFHELHCALDVTAKVVCQADHWRGNAKEADGNVLQRVHRHDHW
ncbi:unnamed protein product [Peronospora belbahrii]|uniref:PX domain-containing protein n=1 Tax=Peronospora belbahrii TaxID=622444 RepID=A0AAU9L9P4_9STRA|nr:unnamed protein product [Peronospora belbahrii]